MVVWPLASCLIGVWRSWLTHMSDTHARDGSNPSTPTILRRNTATHKIRVKMSGPKIHFESGTCCRIEGPNPLKSIVFLYVADRKEQRRSCVSLCTVNSKARMSAFQAEYTVSRSVRCSKDANSNLRRSRRGHLIG